MKIRVLYLHRILLLLKLIKMVKIWGPSGWSILQNFHPMGNSEAKTIDSIKKIFIYNDPKN